MKWSEYTGFIELSEKNVLVFNSISGHIDIVEKELVPKNAPDLEEEVKTYFAERGYLTGMSPEDEELMYTNLVQERYRESQKTKKHVIALTYDCNLRCTYCYEQNLRNNGSEWMQQRLTKEMVDNIYTIIDRYDAEGDDKSTNIVLFGGEPLLPENREIVEYIFQEGTKRGRKFAIVTNGTTLDQYMDLITTYPVRAIQITIDGVAEVHDQRRFAADGSGTFDIIIKNMLALSQHKQIKIDIKVSLDEENREGIDDLIAYFRELGLTEQEHIKAHLAPVFNPVNEDTKQYNRHKILGDIFTYFEQERNEEIFSEGLGSYHPLEEIFETGAWRPKYSYCLSGRQFFYDALGNMYCCWETVGHEEYSVGKFYPEIEMNNNFEPWTNRNIVTIEQCKKCKYALFCGGGCAYGSCKNFGDVRQPNCDEMHLFFSDYLPSFVRRHLSHL